MPIHCPIRFQPLSDAAFASIDRAVMRCCYDSQNTLGRLCDERVYESDVAARLRAEHGFEVQTQVPVTVTHDGFVRIYRLDMVVDRMVYELKTVEVFVAQHDTQAIHYAAMAGTDRVKLINFRPPKVIGRLLGSPLWRVDRRRVSVRRARWRTLSGNCADLAERMTALLGDWGAFLEAPLYEEALVHFCGGEPRCLTRLPVYRDGIELGTHRFACHADGVAFTLTALTGAAEAHELHLRRLLRCTPLRGLQWMNLDHAELQFVTMESQGRGMEAKA